DHPTNCSNAQSLSFSSTPSCFSLGISTTLSLPPTLRKSRICCTFARIILSAQYADFGAEKRIQWFRRRAHREWSLLLSSAGPRAASLHQTKHQRAEKWRRKRCLCVLFAFLGCLFHR